LITQQGSKERETHIHPASIILGRRQQDSFNYFLKLILYAWTMTLYIVDFLDEIAMIFLNTSPEIILVCLHWGGYLKIHLVGGT
jgi:hypothetical protein